MLRLFPEKVLTFETPSGGNTVSKLLSVNFPNDKKRSL